MKKRLWTSLFFIILTLGGSVLVSKNVEDTLVKSIAIVSAVGIDKGEEGYFVTLQVINPTSNPDTTGDEPGTTIYQQSGKTISQAMRNISNTVSRKIFLDSAELILIGEELAKEEGIRESLSFFLTESETSSNIKLLITKGFSANTILKIVTPVQKVSSHRMKEILYNNELNLGSAINEYPNKVMNALLRDIKQTVIPYISFDGDPEIGTTKENTANSEPVVNLMIDGMAYFKKDKLAGFLEREQSKTYNSFTNSIKKTIVETTCGEEDDGYFAVNIRKAKTKIKTTYKDGKPAFHVKHKVKGEVLESTCKQNVIEDLQVQAEKSIKSEFRKLITKSQEENNDFIGFLKEVYLKDPFKFDEVSKQWEQIYPSVPVTLDIDMTITNIGDVSKVP